MRLYALPFLVFLLSCAPRPPEHPRPAGTVVSMVFYETVVDQESIRKGLESYYRGYDVEFDFAYDVGAGLNVIFTDDTPQQWHLPPQAAGMAPEVCSRPAVGIGLALQCALNPAYCAYSGSHELAHLLGLEHVEGNDVMGETIRLGRRFEDLDLPTIQGRCRKTQNSAAMLRRALGPAPGPRP